MWILQAVFIFCTIITTNGDNTQDKRKILGGSAISINSVPYQVLFLYRNQQLCGGSIIADRWIITAAHCLLDFNTKQIKIRAGSSYAFHGGQLLQITRTIIHPNYNNTPGNNDVALVEVNQQITAGKKILLATTEPAAGSNAYISGWGFTRNGGQSTTMLRGTQIKIVRRSSCSAVYAAGTDSRITTSMICASGNYGKDACQGDSGGPLAVDGKLAGIVSFGITCANPKYPGVYVNVAAPVVRNFVSRYVKV